MKAWKYNLETKKWDIEIEDNKKVKHIECNIKKDTISIKKKTRA